MNGIRREQARRELRMLRILNVSQAADESAFRKLADTLLAEATNDQPKEQHG